MLESLRKKIPWFPKIDYRVCRKDLRCLNNCPHDVFEWNKETGKPVVAHPYECSPGCQICLEDCDAGALSLPSKEEFQAGLQKIRDAYTD